MDTKFLWNCWLEECGSHGCRIPMECYQYTDQTCVENLVTRRFTKTVFIVNLPGQFFTLHYKIALYNYMHNIKYNIFGCCLKALSFFESSDPLLLNPLLVLQINEKQQALKYTLTYSDMGWSLYRGNMEIPLSVLSTLCPCREHETVRKLCSTRL